MKVHPNPTPKPNHQWCGARTLAYELVINSAKLKIVMIAMRVCW